MSYVLALTNRRQLADTAPRRPFPIAATLLGLLGALNVATLVATLLAQG